MVKDSEFRCLMRPHWIVDRYTDVTELWSFLNSQMITPLYLSIRLFCFKYLALVNQFGSIMYIVGFFSQSIKFETHMLYGPQHPASLYSLKGWMPTILLYKRFHLKYFWKQKKNECKYVFLYISEFTCLQLLIWRKGENLSVMSVLLTKCCAHSMSMNNVAVCIGLCVLCMCMYEHTIN